MKRVTLGAILATQADVRARKSDAGVITVTVTDIADSIEIIGAPWALTQLACRIQTAVVDAAFGE